MIDEVITSMKPETAERISKEVEQEGGRELLPSLFASFLPSLPTKMSFSCPSFHNFPSTERKHLSHSPPTDSTRHFLSLSPSLTLTLWTLEIINYDSSMIVFTIKKGFIMNHFLLPPTATHPASHLFHIFSSFSLFFRSCHRRSLGDRSYATSS